MCATITIFVIWSEHPNIDMHRPGRWSRVPAHTLIWRPLARALERWHSAHTLWTWRLAHTLWTWGGPIRSERESAHTLWDASAEICWHALSVPMYTIGRTLRACILTEWVGCGHIRVNRVGLGMGGRRTGVSGVWLWSYSRFARVFAKIFRVV